MDYVERRYLSEVLTMYSLEPDLKDIYVEGITDQLFYNKVLNCIDVEIKQIDSINFSELYGEKVNLQRNNRNKLIEFSNQLFSGFGVNLKHISCIVDSDYDFFSDSVIWNCYLRYTDYTSLEMYFLNESTINHLCDDVLHGFPISSKKIISELTNTLTEVFFIRLALKMILKKRFKEINFIDIKKTIVINKDTGKITFDALLHIHKILNSNKQLKIKPEVIACFNEIKEKKYTDNRFQIRGHDFTHLLFLLIDKIKNNIKLNEDTLERILPLCTDIESLKHESLLLNLNQKYSAQHAI